MAIDPRPVPYVVAESGDAGDAPDVALPIALYGAGGGGGGSVAWSDVTGKPAVIGAGATQAAARTAIGAGTSDLAIGTTATTAKAGNYTPAWADVTGKPTSFAPSAHAATLVNVAADATNGVSAGNAQAVISALAARIKALEDAAA